MTIPKNQHISLEPLLNNRMVRSPAGTTTDRQVVLADNTAVKITPTSGCTCMFLYNPSTSIYYIGGASLTTSRGLALFQKSTFQVQSPDNDFEVYVIQNSGGALNIHVIEFF